MKYTRRGTQKCPEGLQFPELAGESDVCEAADVADLTPVVDVGHRDVVASTREGHLQIVNRITGHFSAIDVLRVSRHHQNDVGVATSDDLIDLGKCASDSLDVGRCVGRITASTRRNLRAQLTQSVSLVRTDDDLRTCRIGCAE